jgi:hypothetical protein
MTEFNKTLGLGMVKRGVASVATSGVETAVHIVINKLIPALSQGELEVLLNISISYWFKSNFQMMQKRWSWNHRFFYACNINNICIDL